MLLKKFKTLKAIGLKSALKVPYRRILIKYKNFYLNITPITINGEKIFSLNKVSSIEEFDEKLNIFFFNPEKKSEINNYIKNHYPSSIKTTIKESNKICGHYLNLLGSRKIKLKIIDWHLDFKSGYKWDPSEYYINNPKLTNYVNKNIFADVKIPWELSRFQFLPTLGKSYWFTDDEKYAEKFMELINSWIEKNPVELGVNWACTMDVAIRAVNWIWAYYFFYKSKKLDNEFKTKFLQNLYLHGRHIHKNLELDIKSNHYISNIVGLFYLGIFFNRSEEGKKWLNDSINWLNEEIFHQVNEDGISYECSISYHRLVTELFISATILGLKNNISFSEVYLKRLEEMVNFIKYYTKPDSYSPVIGDNDDGRLHILSKYSSRDINDHSYLLSVGSLLFNRPDLMISDSIDEEAFWLLNDIKKKNEYNSNQTSSKAFTKTGYYIMRNKELYLITDCSNPKSKAPQGHRHNSALSFELFAFDKSFIIDPGTYIYTANKKMRNLFRSTAYHNVVEVDDEEQNRSNEEMIFHLANDTKTTVNKWISKEEFDFLDAEHYGYERLKNPVKHRRIIYFDKIENYWVIKDKLSGKGIHQLNFYLHFSPSELEHYNYPCSFKTNEKGANIMILPLETENLNYEVSEGWISKSYGIKEKAPILKYSKKTQMPTEFITLIYPYKNEINPEKLSRIYENIGEIMAELENNN